MGILLLALAGAWIAAQWVVNTRLAEQRQALSHALDFTVDALQDEASGAAALGAAMLMGLNEWPFKSAALGHVPPDASTVMDKLSSARALFAADGAYVISASGVVVAHATKERSATGTNVSFRPYFKNALAGAPNVYAAVGSVSGERGLYYAAPLRNDMRQNSEIIGVVMLKMPSDKIDQLLRFAGANTLLLSPQGVVFASTRQDWLLRMTPPLDAARLDDIRKLRQFGRRFDGATPQVLPFGLERPSVELDGVRYVVLKKIVEWNDPAGQWQAVSLNNASALVTGTERWGAGLVAFVVLAAVGLLLLQVVVGRRRVATATARYNMMGTALEVSPMAVAISNTQGKIEWVNAQLEKDSGYAAKELVNLPVDRLLAPADRQQEFPRLAKIVLAGNSWRGELNNLRKDGSQFPGHIVISPIFGPKGRVTGFVNILEDTTEAVAMQQELVRAKEAADAANRSKGHFLANMSHEIRTPMNAIIGMAYLVRQTGLNARQTDYVVKIEQAGQHLLAIIDDILDVSKVEAGKLTLEHIPFELANVLDQVVSVVQGKAAAKGLELACEVAPGVPHRLVGDPLRLRQILINYANNAVKFTTQGSVRIRVQVQRRLGDTVIARFCVIDTGMGLTDEQASRLFQSFEQADVSTTREFGGTGLGLAISKGLAELMGGQVGVHSQWGRGANFWFTARLGVAVGLGVSQAEAATVPSGLAALEPLRGARVLVVDDNDINQQVAGELLGAAGLQVHVAGNGKEATLQVATMNDRNTPYDLVLMDLQMPVMDGITATGVLRADTRNRDLPVAAMTANAMPLERERCFAAGMTGFVAKPIDPELLWQLVAQLIQPRPGLGVDFGVAQAANGVAGASGGYALPKAIDGLDIPLGLRRVMGRQDLYLSLLRKFSRSQADAMPRLQSALDAQDAPLALRIAHTLKGVSGSIGAVDVEGSATLLEAALQSGQDGAQIQPLMLQCGQHLATLLGALARVPADTPAPGAALSLSDGQLSPPPSTAFLTPPPFDTAEFGALCNRLAQLLAQQDFEAEELFARHRGAFATALGSDSLAIQSAIERFDFEAALAELKRACDKQSITIS